MSPRKYSVRWFINKFEAIPEDKWTVGNLGVNADPDAPKCALGHCGMTSTSDYKNIDEFPEAAALGKHFLRLLPESRRAGLIHAVYSINDASGSGIYSEDYTGTPRARVLDALNRLLLRRSRRRSKKG